ncbi:MAG: autotransporter-associated beta strand repeat-containing protein, partial [Verrucomicrobiota bacterium]
PNFTPTTQNSTILASDIVKALDIENNDVTITTGSGSGNITVNSSISSNSNHLLTLDAYGSIEINAPISGNVNVKFIAETGGISSDSNGIISGSGDTIFNVAGSGTCLGAIIGNRTLTKLGLGNLTLSGANDYTGSTTISEGTLTIDGAGVLGNGSYSGNIFNDSALVFYTSAPLQTLSGIISGSGTLSQMGSGILTLSGANNYTGQTYIYSGTMVASNSSALGTSGGISVYSGILELDGNNIEIDKVLSLTGGTLSNKSGTNTYGGNIILWGPATINADAGTLTLSKDMAVISQNYMGSPLTVSGLGDVTIEGNIVDNYHIDHPLDKLVLNKIGSGTLTLSGQNTYTGNTIIQEGAIKVSSATGLGDIKGGTTVASGASLELDNVTIGDEELSLTGGTLRSVSGDNVYQGLITFDGPFTIDTAAGTSLTLTNTISGPTSQDVPPRSPITVSGAGDVRVDGKINENVYTGSIPIDLIMAGTGTLTLANSYNNYTGNTIITSGKLILGASGVIPNGDVYVGYDDLLNPSSSGGVLDIQADNSVSYVYVSGSSKIIGSGVLTGAYYMIDCAVSTTTTISATLGEYGDNSVLIKSGDGTLTLSGVNTYAGVTTINGGTISIDADRGLGAEPTSQTPGQLVINGGKLETTGNFSLSSNRGIYLTMASGTFSTADGTKLVYDGIIAGSGGLTKVGAGTLTLSGLNTYDGVTTIKGGTISIDADSGLGAEPTSQAIQLVINGGTLETTGNFSLSSNRGIYLTMASGTFSTADGTKL